MLTRGAAVIFRRPPARPRADMRRERLRYPHDPAQRGPSSLPLRLWRRAGPGARAAAHQHRTPDGPVLIHPDGHLFRAGVLAGDFPQIAALDVLCITATRSVLLYTGFWGADQARCWVKVPLASRGTPGFWCPCAW